MLRLSAGKLKTGIFQKGLIIVLLPLLINSFLIALLYFSLERASLLLESSRRHSIVVNTLSRDLYAVIDVLISGSNAVMNGTYDYFRPIVETSLNTIGKDISDIAAISLPDLHFDRTRAELVTLLNSQRQAISKQKDSTMAKDDLVVKLKRAGRWFRQCENESNLLNTSLENAQNNFQQSVNLQHREQFFIGGIIILTLLSNLILSCLLAVYFHRHIAGRVGKLIKIAGKLPTGQAITEHLSGEDELNDLAGELRSVGNELRQIEEYRKTLMQMMAHDLRSPLMGAEVAVDVLTHSSAEGRASESSRKILDDTKDSLSSCLRLVNDLLLLESIDCGSFELDKDQHDIAILVKDSAQKMEKAAAKKGVQIKVKIESNLVNLDYDQMAFVLERSLWSAVKRAPKGSAIEIRGEADGYNFRIAIKDFGRPLNSKECRHIFDRLYQAGLDNADDQPGLGLAAVMPLVILHGGTIGFTAGAEVVAEPAVGKGFRLVENTTVSESDCNRLWFSLPRNLPHSKSGGRK